MNDQTETADTRSDVSDVTAMKSSLNLLISAEEVYANCSPGRLLFWHCVGGFMITLTGCLFYLLPLFAVALPIWLARSGLSRGSICAAAICFLLFQWPAKTNNWMMHSKLYSSVALYFRAEIWSETPMSTIRAHPKPLIWLLFPHGVMSFGGWSFGSLVRARPNFTATATILHYMPILRNILGVFGIIQGSRNSLKAELRKGNDVSLYPGGVAELFLSNPDQEQLYFQHRKGCIKLAMETNTDIIVAYLFGNSCMYHILISAASARISRMLRSTLTIFWGRYGTPLALQTKVVVACGQIIEMPDYSHRLNELTMEVINDEHARVMHELARIFESGKSLHPQYKGKELLIS